MKLKKRSIGNGRNKLFLATLGAVFLSPVLATPLAVAEETLMLEEIIVTAQHRAQNLQDVPVSVSAFSGEALEEIGVFRPADLMNITPGLSGLNRGDAYSSYAVRGISSNVVTIDSEASVGVFVDDMYVGRFGGAASSMFDIERVEVLKGPQSTMFGRNSSAGAISIKTNKASTEQFEARTALRYGSNNSTGGDFALNMPVNDELAVRFAGRVENTDGDGKHALSGNDAFNGSSTALRFSLHYEPNDAVVFDLSSEYEKDSIRNPGLPDDPSLPSGPFDKVVYHNVETDQDVDLWGVNGRLSVDFGDGYQLKSVTAYRTFDYIEPKDLDGTPLAIANFTYATGNDSIFQDLRLHSEGERSNWFIGLSYWNEETYGTSSVAYSEVDILGDGCDAYYVPAYGIPNPCLVDLVHEKLGKVGETTSYSIYGDVIFDLTERLTLSAGMRYSQEEKTMNLEVFPNQLPAGAPPGPTIAQILLGADSIFGGNVGTAAAKQDFTPFQPRLAIDFAVNDDYMIYASVGRGFKAGGINMATDATAVPFGKEQSWSYELGLKSSLFDGRAQWNTSAYYYEYEDYQDRVLSPETLQSTIANAGAVIGYGIETEFEMQLTESTNLTANATWNSTEYKDYTDIMIGCAPTMPCISTVSFDGNRVPYTPEFSGTVALRNVSNLGGIGELSSFLMYSFNSQVVFNRASDDGQDSVGLLGGRLTLRPDGADWSIGVFGDNLLDEKYLVHRETYIASRQAIIGQRRTLGAEFKFEF